LNAVAVTTGRQASAGWGTKGEEHILRAFFESWASEPREILDAFRDWMIWPLLAMPPLPRWTEGRAALLGDAAHPLVPFLASGAVMAIEDAAVLAAETARTPGDHPMAFRAYEARRLPRASKVQQASARMGDIYHMSGPMRLARNLTLAALPSHALLARNDWLYDYRVGDQDGG
jgi:salicylate hydroxylase